MSNLFVNNAHINNSNIEQLNELEDTSRLLFNLSVNGIMAIGNLLLSVTSRQDIDDRTLNDMGGAVMVLSEAAKVSYTDIQHIELQRYKLSNIS